MTARLATLREVAKQFDAIVLDQWGVLHDGTAPYPGAVEIVSKLKADQHRLAVLSNSGKRAAPNAARIAAMGFGAEVFETVMTSGEALWQDIREARIPERVFFPIERAKGDAMHWAEGLEVQLVNEIGTADAVLLMGLPDDAVQADFATILETARADEKPIICTNPDRASPRANGRVVVSPGTLAHTQAEWGGQVQFYGKPHLPVFRALEAALGLSPDRLLIVGDSIEHDIAGGHAAGWSTCLIQGGLHAADFADLAPDALDVLIEASGAPAPDFLIARLQ